MTNDPLPAAESSPDDLKAQYNSLHSLVMGLILLVIVISGTLCIFLLRQTRYATFDLEMVKANHANARAQFDRTQTLIDQTVKKLQDFGRTNPDFVPILSKYKLTEGPPTNAAPAKPAAAKK